MNVKLSKQDLDSMSGKATDMQGLAIQARKIVDEAGQPSLTGFQTQAAIAEVTEQWRAKTTTHAGRWEYFAVALTETGDNVAAADEENAFYFPDVNVGVKD